FFRLLSSIRAPPPLLSISVAYTTLFRSTLKQALSMTQTGSDRMVVIMGQGVESRGELSWFESKPLSSPLDSTPCPMITTIRSDRSEEHTSELQSRFDLVCRLLLVKKKSD